MSDSVSRLVCALAVMAIAAGAICLALGLHSGRPKGGGVRITQTEMMISTMSASLSQYLRDNGVYPPDHNDLCDTGAECLVYYLGGPDVNRDKSPELHMEKTYYEFKEMNLTDHDGDGWHEVSDPWWRPFIYRSGPNGGIADAPLPRHRKDSYDLFSVGPDGRTGKPADYPVFDNAPECYRHATGPKSFYEAAYNDDYDGNSKAPLKEAPASADDVANF